MTARLFGFLILMSVIGCQYQTEQTNIASAGAIEPIYRQEVLNNLAKLIDTPNVLPSESKLGQGQNQATGTFTPSMTFPLTSMFTSAIGATTTKTTATAGAGASLGGNLGYQLSYQTAPLTEINDLMNLRAVYMAALCSSESKYAQLAISCRSFNFKDSYTPPRIYDKNGWLVYDGYYLQPPLCLLCLDIATTRVTQNLAFVAVDKSSLNIVDLLQPTNNWLYWSDAGTSTPIPANMVRIGTADGKIFYATSYAQFADFILRTLPLPVSPVRPTLAAVAVPVPSERERRIERHRNKQPLAPAIQRFLNEPLRRNLLPKEPSKAPPPNGRLKTPAARTPETPTAPLMPGSPEGGKPNPVPVQPFPPIQ